MACIRALIQSSRSTAAAAPFGKSKIWPYNARVSSVQLDLEPSGFYSSNEESTGGGFNWDNLGFSLTPTDYMYTMKCGQDAAFEPGRLVSFGSIGLNPAAGVLNYGQGIFEGMKAQRRPDGKIVLFRPDLNAKRMQLGADRMCMPAPSVEQFIQAAKETSLANNRWVPPFGKGSLYMRPMLLGSGAMLGVAPAPEYTYLIYSSPVGHYFKEGSAPMKLYVEEELHRAQQGGTGAIKSITNYGPVRKNTEYPALFDILLTPDMFVLIFLLQVLRAIINAKREGNLVSTPATSGTILDGVTRRSVIEIAMDLGYQVKERTIPVDELSDADEVFCTGTAVGIARVGSITYKGNRIEYKPLGPSVAEQLQTTLVGIQTGLVEDKKGWTVEC
ncbi:hypothetical protein QQ045_001435 [Rhodiola kirilowii]